MNGLWFIIAGGAWMLYAVLIDPWGTKPHAAALYLVGAAMFIVGTAQ